MEWSGTVEIQSFVSLLVGQSHAVAPHGHGRSTQRPDEQSYVLLTLLPVPVSLNCQITGANPPVELTDVLQKIVCRWDTGYRFVYAGCLVSNEVLNVKCPFGGVMLY